MINKQQLLIRTAKLEAEGKMRDALDQKKEFQHKSSDSEDKVNSLKKEMSGLRQAWGASNLTKNTEYKSLMKADNVKLAQEVVKATKLAFEEG